MDENESWRAMEEDVGRFRADLQTSDQAHALGSARSEEIRKTTPLVEYRQISSRSREVRQPLQEETVETVATRLPDQPDGEYTWLQLRGFAAANGITKNHPPGRLYRAQGDDPRDHPINVPEGDGGTKTLVPESSRSCLWFAKVETTFEGQPISPTVTKVWRSPHVSGIQPVPVGGSGLEAGVVSAIEANASGNAYVAVLFYYIRYSYRPGLHQPKMHLATGQKNYELYPVYVT